MPRPLLILSQSDYLIWIVTINSHTEWQTVQIQISWFFKKPTDLDLHCLQSQGISGFSRTRVKVTSHSVVAQFCFLSVHAFFICAVLLGLSLRGPSILHARLKNGTYCVMGSGVRPYVRLSVNCFRFRQTPTRVYIRSS